MKSPESEWRENAKPEDNYLRFYLELSAVHIWYAKVEVKSRLRRKAALAISGILKKKKNPYSFVIRFPQLCRPVY